jgi:hypothetical protein
MVAHPPVNTGSNKTSNISINLTLQIYEKKVTNKLARMGRL